MLKNKLVFILIFFMVSEISGQFEGEYGVGLKGSIFYYQLFNRIDFKSSPHTITTFDGKPKGRLFEANVEYNLSDNSGFSIGVSYSEQSQMYLNSKSTSSSHGNITYHYNSDLNVDLKYISLPIHYYWFRDLSKISKSLYIKGSLGMQLSIISDYIVEYTQYYWDFDTGSRYDSIYIYKQITPFLNTAIYINHPSGNNDTVIKEETQLRFNRFTLEFIGNVSLEYYIRNIFKLRLGMEIRHSLTPMETFDPEYRWPNYFGLTIWNDENFERNNSYNQSIGLFFSVVYILNRQSYYK